MSAKRPQQEQPVENNGLTSRGVFGAAEHKEVLDCLLDHATRIDASVAALGELASTVSDSDAELHAAIQSATDSATEATTALAAAVQAANDSANAGLAELSATLQEATESQAQALAAETQARQDADVMLQSNVDAQNDALTTEAESRADADAVIQEKIVAHGIELIHSKISGHYNRIRNHGTFFRIPDGIERETWSGGNPYNSIDFDPAALEESLLIGYNGLDLSAGIESGRTIYNSVSFGGTQPECSTDTLSFLAGIENISGVSNAWRYRSSFAISRFVMGNGASSTSIEVDGDNYFRGLNLAKLTRYAALSAQISFSYYIKPVTEPVYVFGYGANLTRKLYLNNEQVDSDDPIRLAPDTVHHVCHTWKHIDSLGYSSTAFHWLLKNGAEFDIALPVLLPIFSPIPPSIYPWQSFLTTQSRSE